MIIKVSNEIISMWTSGEEKKQINKQVGESECKELLGETEEEQAARNLERMIENGIESHQGLKVEKREVGGEAHPTKHPKDQLEMKVLNIKTSLI